MSPDRKNLAFARVVSNLLLGGSAFGALIALMNIWMRDNKERER